MHLSRYFYELPNCRALKKVPLKTNKSKNMVRAEVRELKCDVAAASLMGNK